MSNKLPRAQQAPHEPPLEELLGIARDLTSSLAAEDRYARLLSAVRRMIPCDAACLLRLEDGELVPLAGHGLADEAVAMRYPLDEHPRLARILEASEPVRFPEDSPLPDPFDGLLAEDPEGTHHIHACLGCRLTEGGEVVGALTADALDPRAFDGLDLRLVATLGALAGAALKTTSLIESLERLARHRGRVARELQREAARSSGGQILGNSPAIRRLLEDVQVVARSDLPVLISGETGVGKELVARAVHEASGRRDEALIQVNCAALPETIAESELFGHVAGAFTGATRNREGKFELAHGGTLFLDEVGELPASLQPKLLRALQQGEIQRVGSDRTLRVDVRVVAATNRDLERAVRESRFRADLFHRLAAYPIRVPPLRERREDIPLLAAHFLERGRRRLGLSRVRMTERARDAVATAEWPGNVRELQNVIARGVLRAAATVPDDQPDGPPEDEPVIVSLRHLDLRDPRTPPPAAQAPTEAETETAPGVRVSADSGPLSERVDAYKRNAILAALEDNDGNWAAAARDLGMHRSNLHHLAKRLGLRQ
jgi:anaerobic nitric oxide reductase transcription regulator